MYNIRYYQCCIVQDIYLGTIFDRHVCIYGHSIRNTYKNLV